MKKSSWQQVQAAARESRIGASRKVKDPECETPASVALSRTLKRVMVPTGEDMTRRFGDYVIVPGPQHMTDGTFGDCVTILRRMRNGSSREQRFEALRFFSHEVEACWSALMVGRALITGDIPGLQI
jgi:hypothetical protein